jgi:hypothetical protein
MRPTIKLLGAAAILAALGCEQPAGQSATSASSPADPHVDDSGPFGDDSSGGPHEPKPDAALALHCNPWVQNCAAGQKCSMYATQGDGVLDAAKCVALPATPRKADEPCLVDGAYGSGLDDCDAGMICWDVGQGSQGICVPLCDGCSPDPQCPDGRVCAAGVGNFHYMCLPGCDPLQQNCIEGASCVLSGDGFVCVQDGSGFQGQLYDTCLTANGCDPGYMCGPPDAAPNCDAADAAGCCLPFCAVGGSPCPDSLACVPLFDPEQFPEHAEFGVCTTAP